MKNIQSKEIKEAQDIFLKAANYIRTYGWQEKGMSKHKKPRCSMGALASAHPKKIWKPEVAQLMYDTLYKKLEGINLTQFNARAKNGEDVAQLFEQIARSLKS